MTLGLEDDGSEQFKSVMNAVENYDVGTLLSFDIKKTEIGNVVAFFEKYVIAGFQIKQYVI